MTARGQADVGMFIHDMNSKCASLKSAAGLLRTASPKEAREILALMSQQARRIIEDIASFEASVPGP